MSQNSIVNIAEQWFKAFNEHNLENLLALYNDSAQHYSPKLKIRKPETQGLIKGKNELRAWWKDSFERLPTLRYMPQRFIANEASIFMEYIRSVAGEEDMVVGEVLEIKDGLIVASKVFHG